jgi:hypothetical protein
MKPTINKLSLNQETVRNLTIEVPDFSTNPNSNHSCRSACGLPCTPVLGN